MAQNFWTAIIAFTVSATVTVVLTLCTRQIKSDEELNGLVYSLTERSHDENIPWFKKPVSLAVLIMIICIILTIIFW